LTKGLGCNLIIWHPYTNTFDLFGQVPERQINSTVLKDGN